MSWTCASCQTEGMDGTTCFPFNLCGQCYYNPEIARRFRKQAKEAAVELAPLPEQWDLNLVAAAEQVCCDGPYLAIKPTSADMLTMAEKVAVWLLQLPASQRDLEMIALKQQNEVMHAFVSKEYQRRREGAMTFIYNRQTEFLATAQDKQCPSQSDAAARQMSKLDLMMGGQVSPGLKSIGLDYRDIIISALASTPAWHSSRESHNRVIKEMLKFFREEDADLFREIVLDLWGLGPPKTPPAPDDPGDTCEWPPMAFVPVLPG